MKKLTALLVALGLQLAPAAAASIEYDFSGSGSGAIGGSLFTGPFEFRFINSVVNSSYTTTGGFYIGTTLSAILGPENLNSFTPVPNSPSSSLILLASPAGTSFYVQGAQFAGYVPGTAFGPATTNEVTFSSVPSSGGAITFSDITSLTFQAVTPAGGILGTPGPIAGAGLVPLLGLAGAWFARRRKLAA